MAQNFEEKERKYRGENGILQDKVDRLTAGIEELKEENRKMHNGLKSHKEENNIMKDDIKTLQERSKELMVLLDESQKEKEKVKSHIRELLEQNKEIQKKEEEIMKQKIKEQEYLSQVFNKRTLSIKNNQIRTLESFVKSYKDEKMNEKAQDKRNWAASPMRIQGRGYDRTSGNQSLI